MATGLLFISFNVEHDTQELHEHLASNRKMYSRPPERLYDIEMTKIAHTKA
jgi:hypothetical protein